MATTVLIVDDEEKHRDLLGRWLAEWGYEVRLAADARDGLAQMLARPSTILLTDIKMPGHDGFWLIRRVRKNWPRTAVIIATGLLDVEPLEHAHNVGAVDYVVKPFSQLELQQALARAETRSPVT